jgi:hypothetical protein
MTDARHMATMSQSTNRCGTVTCMICHEYLEALSAKPAGKHFFISKIATPNRGMKFACTIFKPKLDIGTSGPREEAEQQILYGSMPRSKHSGFGIVVCPS